MMRFAKVAGSSAVLFILLSLAVSSVQADNFDILLFRETGIDSETKASKGRLLIDGGWLEGIEEGATGTVWRKNRFTGRTDVATVEIVNLAAHEAMCRFVVSYPDNRVMSKDRVEFETVPRKAADILDKAMAEFGNAKYCSAWMYFRGNDSLTADNEFARQLAEQCREQAKAEMAQGPDESERRRMRARLTDLLEIAEVYHKRENAFMADYYVRQAMTIDSTSPMVQKVRANIPKVEF